MPRQRGQKLKPGERAEKKEIIWQMSKDGYTVVAIARNSAVDLDPLTVQRILTEVYKENAEIRKASGVAEKDLIEYVSAMDDDRKRALGQYRRALQRLEEEEALEQIHAEVRAQPSEEHPDGQPPTTAITRALEFHLRGMPGATKAIDSARAATEAKGRVLGLEAAGKEEAKLQLVAKRSDLINILNTPVTVEIKIAEPPPEGWDAPEDDD